MPRAALVLLVLCCLMPASSLAATPLPYLALGDSTAVGVGAVTGGGYPDRLARRLAGAGLEVKLTNLGASGATVADLRRDQLPRATGKGAGLITLCIGINDVLRERPLGEFARDLHVVGDMLMRTKARVVICALPDLTLSPSGQGAPPALLRRIDQYNAAIRTVAERHGFEVADLAEAIRATPPSQRPALFSPDGFHPSAAGYERWADVMWPAVERAVAPRLQARRPAR
ncbi:MAG: SGNH/GDSL hydrolase family protein [Anaeromyxobacter sp.]